VNTSPQQSADLHDLLWGLRAGTASSDDLARLERMVCDDPAVRAFYVRYMHLCADLHWNVAEKAEGDNECKVVDCALGTRQDVTEHPPVPPISSIAIQASPSFHSPLLSISSVGSPLFSYFIAAVLVSMGLLVGAMVHISAPTDFTQKPHPTRSSSPQSPSVNPLPKAPIVASITGMVDCIWEGTEFRVQGSGAANQKSSIINHQSLLHLGDRLALRSGLLELTYDTGARVILQGPVTYEVESPSGGYLFHGKLTAKLEKKSEVRGQRSESANQKSEIINHKSFAVRTPTAFVTDLGTEFGIEVDKDGTTTSHVFRGTIKVERSGGPSNRGDDSVVLHENESIQTRKSQDASGGRVAMQRVTIDPRCFVRRFTQTIGTVDLSDVARGRNGLARLGYTASTSALGLDDTVLTPGGLSDRRAIPSATATPIDRIFQANGRQDAVTLDSAGHTFNRFPKYDHNSSGSVWATGRLASSHYRSLLGLRDEAGITFDLAALSKNHPGVRPSRFRASVFSGASAGVTTLLHDDFQSDTAGVMPRTANDALLLPAIGPNDTGGCWHWACRPANDTSIQVWNNANPGKLANDAGPNNYVRVQRDGYAHDGALWITTWGTGHTANRQLELGFSIWKDSTQPAFSAVAGFADEDSNGRTFAVYFYPNGKVKYHDGDDWIDTGLTCQADTWQEVTVKADLATQTFSLTVGKAVADNLHWKHGTNVVNDIYFGNGAAAQGQFFVDNVKLGVVDGLAQSHRKGFAKGGEGDLWIFVDGRLKLHRTNIRPEDGAAKLDVDLSPSDRFLTIVATGCRPTTNTGWIVLGDPVLDVTAGSGGHP
jgi:hypothetical protein